MSVLTCYLSAEIVIFLLKTFHSMEDLTIRHCFFTLPSGLIALHYFFLTAFSYNLKKNPRIFLLMSFWLQFGVSNRFSRTSLAVYKSWIFTTLSLIINPSHSSYFILLWTCFAVFFFSPEGQTHWRVFLLSLDLICLSTHWSLVFFLTLYS